MRRSSQVHLCQISNPLFLGQWRQSVRKRLLNLIQGSQSYDELKTFCGVIKESFKAACYARGLLDNNKEWHNAIDEAYQWATPFQLRHLFVLLLIYCEVANPLRLWEHTWKSMSEDIPSKQRGSWTEFNYTGMDGTKSSCFSYFWRTSNNQGDEKPCEVKEEKVADCY